MSYDESNIFARILAREIPCETVYENEHALAFRDINPQAPAHAVVIPKGRYASFLEFSAGASADELAGWVQALAETPKALGIAESGFRILSNTGDDARPGFQHEVRHFHVHVVGGRPLGPLLAPLEMRGGVPTAPEVTEDDTTLVMLPVAEEGTPEQVELLAKELDQAAYEVQRLFPCPLPRALRSGGASEIEALRLRLAGAGLPLRSLASSPLLADFEPVQVVRVRLDGDALVLVSEDAERAIKPDERGLLVRGRYSWTVASRDTGRLAKLAAERRRGSSTSIAKPKRTQFAHLYLDGAQPYSIVEDRLVDYSFLGEEMTASAHTNFDKLIGLLTRGGGVTVDDTLLKSAMMIKVVGRSFYEGADKPSSTSPDVEADLLSRLLHLLVAEEVSAS